MAVVSRARLGVRRRYRDDVRLDSRDAKTRWQWCHALVSAFAGAPPGPRPPPPPAVTEGGTGGVVTRAARRRYRDDVRLDSRLR